MQEKKDVTIIGGGNSTHSIVPLISFAGHRVNLLTRQPEKWSKSITMEYILPTGQVKDTLTGELNIITNNPGKIIPNSEIILLCLPVSKYRIILNQIAPFIDKSKKVYLGTLYGQGGFNWMVDEIKKKYHLEHLIYFAIGLVPWITRIREYGKIGMNFGPKQVNLVAVHPKSEFQKLNDLLLNDLSMLWFKTGKFMLVDNFISLTLSVDNQIIHISRLYGLYEKYGGKWTKKEDIPYFYRDFDDLSANILKDLDEDYSKIRKSIKDKFPNKKFTYMLNYLELEKLTYLVNYDIKGSFVDSQNLGHIITPTILNSEGQFVFDKNHRFFTDDLFFGLIIAKWMGEKLELETKTLDKLIMWAQNFIGEKILQDHKLIVDIKDEKNQQKYGLPSLYGFNNMEDIID